MDWLWRRTFGSSSQLEDDEVNPPPSTILPALESNATCIRLLTVKEQTYLDYTVSCTLRSYRIEDAPPYTALSYVWGAQRTPDERPLEVTINGIAKPVRFNLYAFLQYISLASPARSWCQRRFWIDALCINQDDEIEKAEQVSMMGDIYSHAFSVCAWLGPQPNDDDWNAWSAWLSWRGPVILPSAETAKNNNFWNRMWIVQELKSAKRLAFACGFRLATAEQFKSTMDKGFSDFSWVFDKSFTKHRTSLLDWIMRFHSHECADARDKIFAIQNLVPQSQRIEVDYQLTFGEIYLLVLDRQFGDIGKKTYEEIKLLQVFLASFVINMLGTMSMNPGEKYIRMRTDKVAHVEARVESVVAETYRYFRNFEMSSTWPDEKPYDYAFSCTFAPLGSETGHYSTLQPLGGVPQIEHEGIRSTSETGELLTHAYKTIGPSPKVGLATPGVQRGDLICSISGFNRTLVVIRPLVYVPEDLAFGPLSKGSSRWLKPPLEDREKLLFVPIIPEGKTGDAKIWLSYKVIGLAVNANEQSDSNSPPQPHSTSDRPSNRHALHKQLLSMPVRMYLNEDRVDALSNFANAYDDPSLPVEPLELDELRSFDDQREFFVQDPTDPTGQKQLSSKFLDDPRNIIFKTVELAMAKQAKEREAEQS